jgi:hypothetical protein
MSSAGGTQRWSRGCLVGVIKEDITERSRGGKSGKIIEFQHLQLSESGGLQKEKESFEQRPESRNIPTE